VPLINITTNQAIEPARADGLLKQASSVVAGMLDKPERYVMVRLEYNPHMLFGGSEAPLAYLELKSIDLPGDQTPGYSRTLCDLIEQQLQIPADRVYIEFSDAARQLWGWNGATF
jgi:phenylpyruvate tautomerase PptA (4-oxalocrotonate tautomerase family)